MASAFRSRTVLRALARIPASRGISITCAKSAAATASKEGVSDQPFFANEPAGPQVKTSIPGPKNQKAMAELNRVFDTSSVNMLANYQASIGN